MGKEYILRCEVQSDATGFVPTATISSGGAEVFAWRCPFSFSDESQAIVYGSDYGEVALDALRACDAGEKKIS